MDQFPHEYDDNFNVEWYFDSFGEMRGGGERIP